MREKELRLALVCYGGVSLAVYMHGITKEIWRLARASRAFHAGDSQPTGSEAVYLRLLRLMATPHISSIDSRNSSAARYWRMARV